MIELKPRNYQSIINKSTKNQSFDDKVDFTYVNFDHYDVLKQISAENKELKYKHEQNNFLIYQLAILVSTLTSQLEKQTSQMGKQEATIDSLKVELQEKQDYFNQEMAKTTDLEAMFSKIEAENKQLKEKLAEPKKNSSNSSSKPSSDLPDKPTRKRQSTKKIQGRKIGGQQGHTGHCRKEVDPTRIDEIKSIPPTSTTCSCGAVMEHIPEKDLNFDQYDLPEIIAILTRYQKEAWVCPNCKETHYGEIPPEIEKSGILGLNLISFLAFLKAVGHMSYSNLATTMENVGVEISRSHLNDVMKNDVSEALEKPYEEIKEAIVHESVLNIDETGTKEKGKRMWVWAFCASFFSLFHISVNRSSQVLEDILTSAFKGVICSDFYGAYKKFAKFYNLKRQYCLAHLTREFVLIAQQINNIPARKWALRVLARLHRLHKAFKMRLQDPSPEVWNILRLRGKEFLDEVASNISDYPKALTLVKRMAEFGEHYLTFIEMIGVEPTNNYSERTIRFVVIDRQITQGTRGLAGRKFMERVWTTVATCKINKFPFYKFMRQCLKAHYTNTKPPSLTHLPAEKKIAQ